MKFTRNQAIMVVAGVVVWFISMMMCYGVGVIAHNIGHGG